MGIAKILRTVQSYDVAKSFADLGNVYKNSKGVFKIGLLMPLQLPNCKHFKCLKAASNRLNIKSNRTQIWSNLY